jgi:hypothetical protein
LSLPVAVWLAGDDCAGAAPARVDNPSATEAARRPTLIDANLLRMEIPSLFNRTAMCCLIGSVYALRSSDCEAENSGLEILA